MAANGNKVLSWPQRADVFSSAKMHPNRDLGGDLISEPTGNEDVSGCE
jgi:hypothetical protein